MPQTQRAKVVGTRKLRRKIKRLQADVRGDLLAEAALEGAKPIAEDAQRRAPVRTGLLESEVIAVEFKRRRKGHSAEVGVGPSVKAPHGILQELGTAHHAAQPFLRPAFQAKRGRAVLRIGARLRRSIEQIARTP